MACQSYRAYFKPHYCRHKRCWCWKERPWSKLKFDPETDQTEGSGYASKAEAWEGVLEELEARQTRKFGENPRAAN